MEWYWYVLIFLTPIVLVVLKIFVWNKIQKFRGAKKAKRKKPDED